MNNHLTDIAPFPVLDHLLGIAQLTQNHIDYLLDFSDEIRSTLTSDNKKINVLKGKTQINLFFESSTRTQSSFELAGKRLGADVVNMAVANSALKKGETLIDTATTLNAMLPDVLVIRHAAAGAADLLAQKVDCPVINAGDGAHEHPTQALLDAMTIRQHFPSIEGLKVAICGDILHSRVARSNILLLTMLGADVSLIAPKTLLPHDVDRYQVRVFTDMKQGLASVDVVMMLRLQNERMASNLVPSKAEYFRFYGLDQEKFACARKGALIMHPGPMNRGIEIDSQLADGPQSLIRDQVEMGVAIRMAVLMMLNGFGREALRDFGGTS